MFPPAPQRTRLAARRVERGIGQDELAHRAHVGRTLVQRFERGGVPLPIITAVRMARTLGTSVEELFADAVEAADAAEKHHPRLGRSLACEPDSESIEGEGVEPSGGPLASPAPDAAR